LRANNFKQIKLTTPGQIYSLAWDVTNKVAHFDVEDHFIEDINYDPGTESEK
jgi:hypothetical protein